MNRSYEDLNVWSRSKSLAVGIYKITRTFPKEELYGLTSQMRCCVISIASNIAEGCERNNKGEFLQFLGIAKGSLGELNTQCIIAKEIGLLKSDYFNRISSEIAEIEKMLNGLMASLKKPTPKLATSN